MDIFGLVLFGQDVAEQADGIIETLQSFVNLLPFPWNVVAGAALSAGGALFAWKKMKRKDAPVEKTDEKKD